MTKVLLLSMPFGVITRPSLGLSLLKGEAELLNIHCDVNYPSIDFAKKFGIPDYQKISSDWPSTNAQLGEWIFSSALHSNNCSADKYLEKVIKPLESNIPEWFAPWDASLIEKCVTARRSAAEFLQKTYEKFDWAEYDLVGLTSMFQQNTASLAMAKIIKENNPELLIAIGGPNVEGEMGKVIQEKYSFLDFVVSGEGESAFRNILKFISTNPFDRQIYPIDQIKSISAKLSQKFIPNNVFKRTRMSDLPLPNFDDYFEQITSIKKQITVDIPFETSRGCWWGQKSHCVFCGLNGDSMQFNSKLPQTAIRELKLLLEKYNTKNVQIVDNILDLNYFEDGSFLDLLSNEKLPISLFYEVKTNLTLEQVGKLKRSGIDVVQGGVESLNTFVLNSMGKGVSAIQNVQFLRACRESGVRPGWNIIYGIPGERESSYKQMIDLFPLISHLPPPKSTGPANMHRFSPMFDKSNDFGLKNVRFAEAYKYIYPFLDDDLQKIAYVFEFEYEDLNLEAEHYYQLRSAVRNWISNYQESTLCYGEEAGSKFVIDTRISAREGRINLSDFDCKVLEHLSSARTSVEVDKFGATEFSVSYTSKSADFQRLIDKKLILQLDGKFLSLVLNYSSMTQESSVKYLSLISSEMAYSELFQSGVSKWLH